MDDIVSTTEGRNRLLNLGINPDNITKPSISFRKGEGGYYVNNSINVDITELPELNKYINVNNNQLVSHEIGHWLQDYIPQTSIGNNPMFPEASTIDNIIRDITRSKDVSKIGNLNYNYFYKGDSEPMAFVREMRQDMVDRNYIPHKYNNISEDVIRKYVQENKKNRIASFMDRDNQKNWEILHQALNTLPAALPIVAGYAYPKVLSTSQK